MSIEYITMGVNETYTKSGQRNETDVCGARRLGTRAPARAEFEYYRTPPLPRRRAGRGPRAARPRRRNPDEAGLALSRYSIAVG